MRTFLGGHRGWATSGVALARANGVRLREAAPAGLPGLQQHKPRDVIALFQCPA